MVLLIVIIYNDIGQAVFASNDTIEYSVPESIETNVYTIEIDTNSVASVLEENEQISLVFELYGMVSTKHEINTNYTVYANILMFTNNDAIVGAGVMIDDIIDITNGGGTFRYQKC